MRVCHISTYPPTQCGIASYTSDLIDNLVGWNSTVARIVYPTDELVGEAEFIFPITANSGYRRFVEMLDEWRVDVVSLQHEFGIFGGKNGCDVLPLVGNIKHPVVTTFHTVECGGADSKRGIMKALAELSDKVIALTQQSSRFLSTQLAVPQSKIELIRHGIPSIRFRYPEESPLRRQFDSSNVFISAGHFRPTKGYEIALEALAIYKLVNPDFKYVIVGTDQPQLTDGQDYRIRVCSMIRDLRLSGNIEWIDRHVTDAELTEYIISADVGLVTYTDPRQSSSGIIPRFLGCGRPVIATEIDYVRGIGKSVQGLRAVHINDPVQLASELLDVTMNKVFLRSLMISAYQSTRSMLWTSAGLQYDRIFREAISRHRLAD